MEITLTKEELKTHFDKTNKIIYCYYQTSTWNFISIVDSYVILKYSTSSSSDKNEIVSHVGAKLLELL